MIKSLSSGAILSKTRAMFGRRFTAADYANLASKTSVEQAAAYLKKHPAYFGVLENVNERTIHRRELEDLIRQRHFLSFESLCRYELSIGESFAEYILLTSEIELILEAVSRVASNRIHEAVVFTAAPYLDRHIKIDLRALERAKNYDEILEAVKESKFYDTLRGFRFSENSGAGLIEYENALFAKYYECLLDLFENTPGDGTKKALLEMFRTKIDLTNLVHIVRLKKYFSAPRDYIKFALYSGGYVGEKLIEQMLDAESDGEVLSLAKKNSHFSKKLAILDKCRSIDELPERYVFEKSWKEIYFSPHPAVVMISYLNISLVTFPTFLIVKST